MLESARCFCSKRIRSRCQGNNKMTISNPIGLAGTLLALVLVFPACSSSKSNKGGPAATGGSAGASGSGAGGSAGDAGGAGGAGGASGAGGAAVSCSNYTDCPDPTQQVCDPRTATCKPEECGTDTCADPSDSCQAQNNADLTNYACYQTCTPFAQPDGCPSGSECIPTDLSNLTGFCERRGTASESQPCTWSNVATGCAAGLLCLSDNGNDICFKQCNFFATNPGCSATQLCFVSSICKQAGGYQQVGIGSACSSTAYSGDPCGDDGYAWRGQCVNFANPISDQNLTCMRLCRVKGNDCPAGQSCSDVFTTGVIGVCH